VTGDPVLVIASESEHPGQARQWGDGSWTPSDRREARDWLTLCRLLGWGVQLGTPTLRQIPDGVRWLIVACDPAELGEELLRAMQALLEREPALVVTRAAAPASPLAGLARCCHAGAVRSGRELAWDGPGDQDAWTLDEPVRGMQLDGDGDVWLSLDGEPAALARQIGRGTVVTLGFHPAELRDAGIVATAALRTLLIQGGGGPVAWLDMEGVLALRMDDPGGAQNVQLDTFSYQELGSEEWTDLGALLRQRGARLGVAAVPAWLDDGDASRGELLVDGAPAERLLGGLHPSWAVTYRDRSGALHDYVSEFAILRELADEGLVDIALHGYTHVHPDHESWAAAPDRNTSWAWFRDFTAGAGDRPDGRERLGAGRQMLAEFFDVAPTTLVFPGDEWAQPALQAAIEVGIEMVASYYVALLHDDRLCWAEQVCSPYLDEADARWFAGAAPVVGYFHARDVALHGVGWVREHLDAWSQAGAERLISLGDLATALGSHVVAEEGPDGPRAILTTPGGRSLRGVRVRCVGADGSERQLLDGAL
jgi:hypothetical protein